VDEQDAMRIRREVLGDERVDAAVAGTTEFTAPFQDLITRYAWGEIWGSDGLTRAQRSIVTLSVLASLRHWDELGMHVQAAVRNGLTRQEIQQVLLQVSVYAGVPVGNHAFAIARAALDELDADGSA
jgi:4-carboxymuconolactone decarboxylase